MQTRIGNHEYLLEPMNARAQLAVMRRILPVVAHSGPLLRQIVGDFREGGDVFSAIGPLAEAFAMMKDDEVNFVLDTCMGVCRRNSGGNTWQPLMQGGQHMFQDITLAQMMRLTWIVLQENLGSFLGELQSMFQGGLPSQAPNSSPPQTASGFSTG